MGVTTKFSQKEEAGPQPNAEKKKKREKSGVSGGDGGGEGGVERETRERDPATLVLEARLADHPVHQLALAQILVGVLGVVSQVVVSLCNDVHLHLSTLGEGLWAGIVFITVGCLGVFTSSRVTKFTIRSFMVSNICAFIFSLVLLLLASCLLVDILWYQEKDGYAQSGFYILKSFLSLEIVVALAEIILSVTCGSLCYKSSCFNISGALAPHRYPLIPVRIFSVLQILLGVTSFLFFMALFIFSLDSRHSLTCEEIYCGLAFVCIGAFGLYTVKHINMTSLTPFMILNIFGCIFAGILLALATVRILMLDRLQENIISMKQQDLVLLPSLNCTKDVLESVRSDQRTPNIFGAVRERPGPAEIKHNIEECEIMKLENIRSNLLLPQHALYFFLFREANEVVTGARDILAVPRKIYLLEIGLSLVELFTALCCVVLCCRACCCVTTHRPGLAPTNTSRHLTEEEKWEMVVQEYNEYRK